MVLEAPPFLIKFMLLSVLARVNQRLQMRADLSCGSLLRLQQANCSSVQQRNLQMPSPHSNLLLEASALFWTIMRCDTPSVSTIHDAHRHPQQTRANKQAMESLVPRIKALSASLCRPVPEGNTKEKMRRKELEQ